MAASMIWKGVSRARSLCVMQRELEAACTLQRKQYSVAFMEKRMKKTKNLSKQTAESDTSQTKRKVLQDKPLYDIYMTEEYVPQKFTFQQCVEMHKEAAQPAMTNTLHVPIYADIELNLSTTKKAKVMKNIRGLLEFPHKFVHDQKKNLFVFSENASDLEVCRSLGVQTLGGDDLIGYVNQGMIRKDELEACDFIFATPNMAVKLLKLRTIFKDKTPTLSNGCIVTDFKTVIERYMEHVKYKSHKETDRIGRVQVPFGQLNQEMQVLEENFTYMVLELSSLKPPKQEPLLNSIKLIAPPSAEIFELDIDAYRDQMESKASAADVTNETVEADDSDEED